MTSYAPLAITVAADVQDVEESDGARVKLEFALFEAKKIWQFTPEVSYLPTPPLSLSLPPPPATYKFGH